MPEAKNPKLYDIYDKSYRLGVCYYPEHYKLNERKEKMLEDIASLKEMGMSVVRIAEFTWCEMEPEEGVYTFEWLDNIVNLLGKNGIKCILCTPTAAPPIWLSHNYPDTLQVNFNGSRRKNGSRRYVCYNSPRYIEKTRQIVEKLSQRYADNPFVIGFQVDNELGCEYNGRCICDNCKKLFFEWLRQKYTDINGVNEAWGTIFWGQKYQNFEQINLPTPVNTGEQPLTEDGYTGVANPALLLDFYRFSSESIIKYYRMQNDIIKKYSNKPVTTNTTNISPNFVRYDWLFEKADVFAVDFYPDMNGVDKTNTSYIHSFSRNMKKDNFWVLETYAGGGYGNWARSGITQGIPGSYKNNVMYAFASGANLITVFKMHAFNCGFEQLGSSLFDLDRVKRRRFYEFKETGELLKQLNPIFESTSIKAQVAILFDYESLWSMQIKPVSSNFNYLDYQQNLYKCLREYGINVDVITSDKNIDDYKVVVLPCFTISNNKFFEKIRRFTQNGGHVLATFLTANKDENGNGTQKSMPIDLTDYFGAMVIEHDYIAGKSVEIIYSDKIIKNKNWTETLETCGAETIGVFNNSFRKGKAVITKNKYGQGFAYYVGTQIIDDGLKYIIHDVLKNAQVKKFDLAYNENVEIVKRDGGDFDYYFVFNNSSQETKVDCVKDGMTEVLSKAKVKNNFILAPLEMKVIKVKKQKIFK